MTHYTAYFAIAIAASLLAPTALAQSGATGGSLGKSGKSVSGGGGEGASRSTAPAKATTPSARIAGVWRWVANCTTGTWNAGFDLRSAGGNQFTGQFVGDIGSISNGRIVGEQIYFTRNLVVRSQNWTATVSGSGASMSGSLTDPPFGTCTFTARKE